MSETPNYAEPWICTIFVKILTLQRVVCVIYQNSSTFLNLQWRIWTVNFVQLYLYLYFDVCICGCICSCIFPFSFCGAAATVGEYVSEAPIYAALCPHLEGTIVLASPKQTLLLTYLITSDIILGKPREGTYVDHLGTL